FTLERGGHAPADHVAGVGDPGLVAGHVPPPVPPRSPRPRGLPPLLPPPPPPGAGAYPRLPWVGVAGVELRDPAGADRRARLAEAARALRDRDREDPLALLAELGALGDVAEAVEVDVGAAHDRDERALGVSARLARDPFLHPRHRQRAGRLGDHARVL